MNTVELSIILCYSPVLPVNDKLVLHIFLAHTELPFDEQLNDSHSLVDRFPGLIKETLYPIIYQHDHLFTWT